MIVTVPFGAPFSDTLADLLLERAGDDPLALTRTLVLLPSRRAAAALTAAFTRRSARGLLLPAMRGIADLEDADEAEDDGDAPPAIDAGERRVALAAILARGGTPPARALAEAAGLARALGELLAEDRGAADLADAAGDMAAHWEWTLRRLEAVTRHWPEALAARGLVDPETRRARLARALARRWRDGGAGRPVVAAGFAGAPPFAAELIRVVARLPGGLVVLPGLDRAMPGPEWDALGTDPAGPAHPQAGLRRLLDDMGVARGEVGEAGAALPAAAARTGAASRALALARSGGRPDAADRAALAEVRLAEAVNPAEEAQVIALALRRALETPARTAALVTPDRALARRVAALLTRWDIAADDSAGEPLAATPPGAFMALLADAAARAFEAPAVLALLDHPLAGGEAREEWRRHARALELKLRGLPPPPGLRGIGGRVPEAAAAWWTEVATALRPLAAAGEAPLPERLRALVDAGTAIAGEALWRGVDGQALADALEPLIAHGGALRVDWAETGAAVAGALAEAVARRPGAHPRVAILGLLEARLQRADLMVLGGLNEGVWPAPPAPDAWLPPLVRRNLGLPTPERRLGLAAHDFLSALGAEEVLLTRARRDATAPTVASRFVLRLDAAGPLARETELVALARALDAGGAPRPAARPAPRPVGAARPRVLRVTDADLLAADPFAFWAKRVAGLRALEPVAKEPDARDRGVFLHKVMERWFREAGGDPDRLEAFALARFDAAWFARPLLAATWRPRFARAAEWAAAELRRQAGEGRRVLAVEAKGELALDGVVLDGRADRIDRVGDGLAVVDYKTGDPPNCAQHAGGYALQLGLLAFMAEQGALAGVPPEPVVAYAYWKMSGGRTDPGLVCDPLAFKDAPWEDAGAFQADVTRHARALIATYLNGEAPFEAKRKPEYAKSTDYDTLARVDEWIGR